jgi:hypothetical protein
MSKRPKVNLVAGVPYAGPELPRDRSKMSAEERQAVIVYYMSKDMIELRLRQVLCEDQTRLAYADGKGLALSNGQIDGQLLAEAILRKGF